VKIFLLTSFLFAFQLLAAEEWKIEAGSQWKAVDMHDLAVKPSTALDFSFLVEPGEAGQHGFLQINAKGQFVFEKRPDVPVRFWCASQLPENSKQVEWLAEQLRLNGYNAVRSTFLDDLLMDGSKEVCVFNPAKVDLWERYTAALKKRGIYLFIDASTWDLFATSKYWQPGGFTSNRNLVKLYYDEPTREIWMKGVRQIFEHVNPYTGLALKDDPQVILVQMRNESGLGFKQSREPDPGLDKPFREWLKKRYVNREAWAAAWGSNLAVNVTFDNVVEPSTHDASPAGKDLQRFFTDIEQSTYLWGAAFMRSIGIKVPIMDYNVGTSMQSILTRNVLPFVDNHTYHDHNTKYISSGSTILGDNDVAQKLQTYRRIITTRALGKPFTMTEWGGYFWNQYRHHDGMTFPAYLAFNDTQLLDQHGTPVAPFARGIRPVSVATDPTDKAGERMAAFLYARGDVLPSPHHIEIRLDEQKVFNTLNASYSMSFDLTPLALLAGFGNRVVGGAHSAPVAQYIPDLVLDVKEGQKIKTTRYAELATVEPDGDEMEKYVEQLRQKGVLDKANHTDVPANIFESDTEQLYLDAKHARFALNSPRSQGVCLPNGPCAMTVGEIEVENQGACMTLLLTSLSSDPISSSKRLLLILSGDALNTDMVFTDQTCKKLVNIGKGPALARVLEVNLRAHL
jgi:hypothetical protein